MSTSIGRCSKNFNLWEINKGASIEPNLMSNPSPLSFARPIAIGGFNGTWGSL